MKRNSMFRYLILVGLSFAVTTAVAYERNPITFGSVITLKHRSTGKYLTAANNTYFSGGSGLSAVYAGTDPKDASAQWTVKGSHNGDRFNFYFAEPSGRSTTAQIGWPLKNGSFFRLENVATGRNLNGNWHYNYEIAGSLSHNPSLPYYEVVNAGDNGVYNSYCDWRVRYADAAGGAAQSTETYWASGYGCKIEKEWHNWYLYSRSNTTRLNGTSFGL